MHEDSKKPALAFFDGNTIRRTWFNEEWWFSVVDIIEVLTESERPRKYWSDLNVKLIQEGFEVSEKIGQLKLPAEDAQGYPKVEEAAQRGGKVAGNARKDTEKELGRSVVSSQNYLSEPQKKKKLESKTKKDT